ncbi:MAG: hypothetical protein EKK57_11220 [Proteobacteria bacterium]|nr:MAG: hypothetical protein EKK57_11220 [Pseudomonadota bacterium]
MMKAFVLILCLMLVGCDLGTDYTAQSNFCSITKYQANQDVMTATDIDVITKLNGCWEWSGKCLNACTALDEGCNVLHKNAINSCKLVGIPHSMDMR